MDPCSRGVPRQLVERAARLYRTNAEAAAALGVSMRSFSRLCRRYDVETPWMKRRRDRK